MPMAPQSLYSQMFSLVYVYLTATVNEVEYIVFSRVTARVVRTAR